MPPGSEPIIALTILGGGGDFTIIHATDFLENHGFTFEIFCETSTNNREKYHGKAGSRGADTIGESQVALKHAGPEGEKTNRNGCSMGLLLEVAQRSGDRLLSPISRRDAISDCRPKIGERGILLANLTYLCNMPRCGSQPLVAGQQGRAKRFSQSHIGGVVRCQDVPEFPYSVEQQIMGISVHREIQKVEQRLTASLRAQFSGSGVASQNLCDFKVEQMRGMQSFTAGEQTRGNTRSGCRVQQQFQNCRSIHDDHRCSRSALTALAGERRGFTGSL